MSKYLLAIDPGTTESAYVWMSTDTLEPWKFAKVPNPEIFAELSRGMGYVCVACEMIQGRGMPVGQETFETCVWIGRFLNQTENIGEKFERIYRTAVKMHLCGKASAKDPNVRQALIDKYGGKHKAIGKKASPGPLYGMSKDCWQALAVGVTYIETKLK